ncbi:MAG: tRNA-specific adenosine deaminase [Candidatus Anoxychlamydiales bacterium]|nr:tRNA-specific adenosine deaminase [Candidatus Anoxychlamydiales bacterium]
MNNDNIEKQIFELLQEIDSFVGIPGFEHEEFILQALHEAIVAIKNNNFAIGAIITNSFGKIVAKGQNKVFNPYHRSDQHAEMNAVTNWEKKIANKLINLEPAYIFSTLEPCPMCLSRLLSSHVKCIYYAVPDEFGGMARKKENLPKIWKEFMKNRVIQEANCSPKLKIYCKQIFELSDKKIEISGLWKELK